MVTADVIRKTRRSDGFRLLIAALAAGILFDATNLLLRAPLGVPSLPEALSDVLVPFIPASLFGKLLSTLGPYGKQIVFVSSLAGLALGIAVAVLVYRRLVGRVGVARATVGLLLVGWVALVAIFWPVQDANDGGGALAIRHLLSVIDLGVCAGVAALAALALVGMPSITGSDHSDAAFDAGRRRLLGGMAGAVGLLLVGGAGIAAGVRQLMKLSNLGYEGYGTPASALGPITPNRNFYVVSKNLIDPTVDGDRWELAIGGLVDRPITLRLADLRRLPQQDSLATLECIANGVGGSLMSTALWRGPSMRDVLATAGVKAGVTHVELKAIDGYYDTVKIEELGTPGAVLALQMNGEALPDRHGFPARVVLPGRYGEKQMKWLTGIHLTNSPSTGFYQRQGWSEQGTIRNWSRIDNLRPNMRLAAGTGVAVSGHAFCGTRGVSAVQVSIDSGQTWSEASLREDLGRNAWRYFDWNWSTPTTGRHTVVVRVRDGKGDWQETSYDDIVPKGSSGLHRVTINVV
ncbi:MAG: molybdopterin-dependent oxidoreductase [Candidatus Dormibacteria bacterium]